jgi:hypothetical protein
LKPFCCGNHASFQTFMDSPLLTLYLAPLNRKCRALTNTKYPSIVWVISYCAVRKLDHWSQRRTIGAWSNFWSLRFLTDWEEIIPILIT